MRREASAAAGRRCQDAASWLARSRPALGLCASATTKPAAARRRRSSSSTASARTNRCGTRSSRISARSGARSPSIIPAMATATPRPKARRATIMRRRSCRRWRRSASTTRTSAACRSAEWSPSRCTTPRPTRCASLILADTFAAHPDGQAIYERSLAASENMRALAEARVDVLLAQPADPAVRSEVIETMAPHRPRRLSHRRRGGVARRPARARRRHPRRRPWSCAAPRTTSPRRRCRPALDAADPRRALRADRGRRPPRQPRAARRVQHRSSAPSSAASIRTGVS